MEWIATLILLVHIIIDTNGNYSLTTPAPTPYPTRSLVYYDYVNQGVRLLPGDIIYSLDENTKFDMSASGNWMLSSRKNASSEWEMKWSHFYNIQPAVTDKFPQWAFQVDGNVLVNRDWGSPIWALSWAGTSCCKPSTTRGPFYFIVHNGGYAYMLDRNYTFAGWRIPENISITEYPASTLTPEPTTDPTIAPTVYPIPKWIVIDNPSNYSSAEAQCESYGTYLGTIRDLNESEKAYTVCQDGDSTGFGNCWFGYYRQNASEWQWVSPEAEEENITYTRWGNNQPGDDCACIWPNAPIPGYV